MNQSNHLNFQKRQLQTTRLEQQKIWPSPLFTYTLLSFYISEFSNLLFCTNTKAPLNHRLNLYWPHSKATFNSQQLARNTVQMQTIHAHHKVASFLTNCEPEDPSPLQQRWRYNRQSSRGQLTGPAQQFTSENILPGSSISSIARPNVAHYINLPRTCIEKWHSARFPAASEAM